MTGTELSSFYNRPTEEILADPLLKGAHLALIMALERGEIRSALPENGEWIPQTWVKQAILIGFRSTQMEPVQGAYFRFLDKTAYPPRQFGASDGVRLVPGGTAVRRGAFVAPGVVVMPPAYINVGAYVDTGTMVCWSLPALAQLSLRTRRLWVVFAAFLRALSFANAPCLHRALSSPAQPSYTIS